jgi:hypothetical protein
MTKEKENKVIELVGDLLGEVFNLTDEGRKTLEKLADTLGIQ